MSLQAFGDALLTTRPFASDRVSEPRLEHPDVTQIHDREFARLIRRAKEVTSEQTGRGVMILGAAGVGKSHLLGRLYRWTHGDPGATAVFLHNLLVSPERLPRYVLASTIGVLTNGRQGDYADCALYQLWEAAVRKKASLAPEATISHGVAQKAVAALGDSGGPLERAIRQVLLKVGLNMHRAHLEEDYNRELVEAGLDWLSGGALEPEPVERLDLQGASEIAEGLRDDQDVERVFKVLAELSALADRPFIVCVDQFDNLSEPQVRATTRFFHVLIDHVPNLLCVLSGVTDNVLELVDRDVIPAANWDRVAEERVDLRMVDPAAALEIVRTRIEAFRRDFWNVAELESAVKRDPLFPLTRAAFDAKLGEAMRVRPRQMIRWARDAWDAEAERCRELGVAQWLAKWPDGEVSIGGTELWEPLVDEAVEAKRADKHRDRMRNPGSLPADASNQRELVRILLNIAAEQDAYPLKQVGDAPTKSGLDLELTSADGSKSGLAFVITSTKAAATRVLGKLCRYDDEPSRLFVIDDQRRPIAWTDRAQEYRQDLASALGAGFAYRTLDLDQHAQLDALVSVLLQAKSGDIEVEWRGEMHALSEDDVIASFVRTGALEKAPLLSELLAPTGDGSSTSNGAISTGGAELDRSGPAGASARCDTLPDPNASARHLLGLIAAWPEVSVRSAAEVWCEEHGLRDGRELIEDRLAQAALRLSLLGRATCRLVEGLLRIARPGQRPHAIVGVLSWLWVLS
jgi:hypothetical protein